MLLSLVTYSTYHGDNLEGLQTTIGAPVTYSEEQNCLMAQLPESKAFAGRRKLNEELETARKRVAGVSGYRDPPFLMAVAGCAPAVTDLMMLPHRHLLL